MEAKARRLLRIQDPDGNADQRFPNNAVVTSKYTWWSFVPKNLFEQFRRVANVYFLIISLLQVLTDLSPTNKYSTILPLMGVLALSMAKEGVEDWRRHRADHRVNNRPARVFRDGAWTTVLWKDIVVGDVFKMTDGEDCPADGVLVHSSSDDDLAYIQTASLDGESNLKIRNVVPGVAAATPAQLQALRGSVQCELPNNQLYRFQGFLRVEGAASGDAGDGIPLSNDNVILRGTTLQNTKHVVAVVVYSGADTKLVRNSTATPSKRSHVDRLVNQSLVIVFVALMGLCTITAVATTLWGARGDHGYLPRSGSGFQDVLKSWITVLILLNNLVPISLYVSLEVVKWTQARQMEADPAMVHKVDGRDVPAVARTSNLNEDLGQVEYVFSDKTGTLTRNVMEFKKCSIGARVYGEGGEVDQGVLAVAAQRSTALNPLLPMLVQEGAAVFEKDARFHFEDASLLADLAHDRDQSDKVVEFMTSLATCHTVIATASKPNGGQAGAGAGTAVGKAKAGGIGGLPVADVDSQSASDDDGEEAHRGNAASSRSGFSPPGTSHVAPMTDAVADADAGADGASGGVDKGRRGSVETADVEYQAASPDEAALVMAAKCFGVKFLSRTPTSITVSLFGKQQTFGLLAVNEFTSKRKRMSVLLRRPDGSLVLYCKGADNVLFPLFASSSHRRNTVVELPGSESKASEGATINDLDGHLREFAAEGLRTLVVASREVREEEAAAWLDKYREASTAVGDREELMERVAAEIEHSFHALGSTAIEDKLQVGVPDTIASLADAGCKIWMLTGDKEETAINIGRSCKLLKETMKIITLNAVDREGFIQQLATARAELRSRGLWSPGNVNDNLAIVIQGHTLVHVCPPAAGSQSDDCPAGGSRGSGSGRGRGSSSSSSSSGGGRGHKQCFKDRLLSLLSSMLAKGAGRGGGDGDGTDGGPSWVQLEANLLELIQQCKAVIGCRVSPLQKAQVVRMIKTRVMPTPRTLAVGDGGNDVSMIQEAHVGVGIIGLEGMQAVQASDYAVAQFRFLKRMLLVHGRWNYRRVSKVVLYSFYKNITLVLTLFMFGAFNGWSGTTLYESWLGAGWNVGWTFLPVLALGVSDQDISEGTVLKYPVVYRAGQADNEFSRARLLQWVVNGAAHALVLFAFAYFTLLRVVLASDGTDSGLWLRGAALNFCLVVVVNLKLAQEMFTFSRRALLYFVISVGAWLVFVALYSNAYALTGITALRDFAGVGTTLLGLPSFWLSVPVVVAATLMVDVAAKMALRLWRPTIPQVVQEWDRGHGTPMAPEVVVQRTMSAKMRAMSVRCASAKLSVFDPRDAGHPTTSPQRSISIGHHLDMCRQLQDLREEIMQEMKKSASSKPSEQPCANIGSVSRVPISPLTHTFIGFPKLETEFVQTFFVHKTVKLTRLVVAVAMLLAALYIVVEMTREFDMLTFTIRATLVLMGFVFLCASMTNWFITHFQAILCAVIFLVGVSKTVMIDESGEFGQTLFQLGILLVLRVRFVSAVVLSILDLVIFCVYTGLSTSNALGPYLLYILFVLGFAAYGSFSLQMAMREDFLQEKVLRQQQQRAEVILNNLMPPHVTERLLKKETLISDGEDDVSVLFCDIDDFSNIASRHTATQLVRLLDHLYSLFDALALKHRVTKMETVGKTYMAAAGLQGVDSNHAIALVSLGKNMIEVLRNVTSPKVDADGNVVIGPDGSAVLEQALHVRVGVHTGKVVSGVVGKKKPQFCLFGDTVNTASRMQSNGEKDRVHISMDTQMQLGGMFSLKQQRKDIKGKGWMTTFFVGPQLHTRPGPHHAARRGAAGRPAAVAPATAAVTAGAGAGPGAGAAALARSSSSSSSMSGGVAAGVAAVSALQQRPLLTGCGTSGSKSSHHEVTATEVAAAKRRQARQVKIRATMKMRKMLFGFQNRELEEQYLRHQTRRMTPNLRRTLSILLLFYVFRLIDSVLAASDRTLDDRELWLRFAVLVVTAITLVASHLHGFAKRGKMFRHWRHWFDAGTLLLGGMGLVLSSSTHTKLALDCIFFFALVSNGGALPFLFAFVVNVLLAATGVVVQQSGALGIEADNPSWFNSFWILSGLIFVTIASWTTEFYVRRRFALYVLTQRETRDSNNLLYQMLPAAIVDQLKEGRTCVSDHFAGVTLLFCDIKGFTTISASIKPEEVVKLLNDLFTSLDTITDKFRVFKVQTIGDAYVMVSGLPYVDQITSKGLLEPPPRRDVALRDNANSTAVNAAVLLNVAFEMLREVAKVKNPKTGEPIEMRIGLHTGSIVAGVIGTMTLRYDCWGTDVLAANLMESNGIPSRIVISETTRAALAEVEGLQFDDHKAVEVKGRDKKLKTFVVANDEPPPSLAHMVRSHVGAGIGAMDGANCAGTKGASAPEVTFHDTAVESVAGAGAGAGASATGGVRARFRSQGKIVPI